MHYLLVNLWLWLLLAFVLGLILGWFFPRKRRGERS